MTLTVVPLTAEHLDIMGVEPGYLLGDYSFAALRDGVPVAASGVIRLWEGRGSAFFFQRGLTMKEWTRITRLVRDGIKEAGSKYRRIEIAVRADFDAGHRWAEKLGFLRESFCRKYLPDGADAWRYVIIFE